MKKLFLSFIFFIIIGFANAQNVHPKTTIYFDSNKSELSSNATKTLDSLAASLHTEYIYQVIISGFCDNTGSDGFNLVLSQNRANAVANYFKPKINIGINAGIDTQKLGVRTTGLGESAPVANNNTESGKAKNRRVEIIVNVSRPRSIKDTLITISIPETTVAIAEDKKTFNESSTLTDLEVGKTLVLKNLNFEGGTAVLLPEGKPTLEMLLRTMQNNPTLEIEIGGHVCCFDDMPLSIYRAESVYKYLVRKGIAKERMTYKGYSRNKPIYENDKDENRARINRRVEITVIKK